MAASGGKIPYIFKELDTKDRLINEYVTLSTFKPFAGYKGRVLIGKMPSASPRAIKIRLLIK